MRRVVVTGMGIVSSIGNNTQEVLASLRDFRLSARVIVSSGFMTEEQRDKLKEYGVDGFLDKPYSDQDALNEVRSVLAKRRGAFFDPSNRNDSL